MPLFPYNNDLSACALCRHSVAEDFFRFQCFTLNKRHPYYLLAGSAVHPECLRAFSDLPVFLDFYFATLLDVFLTSHWSLVPVGDEFVDCFDSTLCQTDPPEYDSEKVIDCLLELGQMQRSWKGTSCHLLWESEAETIEYTTEKSGIWTSAKVETLCRPETFLDQFRHVNCRFEQIYLHNQDCTIFTPHWFESIYVNPQLRAFQADLLA